MVKFPLLYNRKFPFYSCVKKQEQKESLKIDIKTWNSNQKEKENLKTFKHLDIGSSNYGPELNNPDLNQNDYVHSPSDPTGEKIHRVLFSLIDSIIRNEKNHKNFTFYLNDINIKGLDKAAENLKLHLKKKYKDENLNIKIVKIAGDIFKVDLPQVDDASFIHPFNRLAPYLILSENPIKTEKINTLFTKIATISTKGLLVKESNLEDPYANMLEEVFSYGGFRYKNLLLKQSKMNFETPYIFPSGKPQLACKISYRVTLEE